MKSPTNIYCSVMVAELLMLYFFNKEINIRNKIASLIVMVFIALSLFISTFILLWHGFDYPIGFQYRNSFIFCFFIPSFSANSICCISYKANIYSNPFILSPHFTN